MSDSAVREAFRQVFLPFQGIPAVIGQVLGWAALLGLSAWLAVRTDSLAPRTDWGWLFFGGWVLIGILAGVRATHAVLKERGDEAYKARIGNRRRAWEAAVGITLDFERLKMAVMDQDSLGRPRAGDAAVKALAESTTRFRSALLSLHEFEVVAYSSIYGELQYALDKSESHLELLKGIAPAKEKLRRICLHEIYRADPLAKPESESLELIIKQLYPELSDLSPPPSSPESSG